MFQLVFTNYGSTHSLIVSAVFANFGKTLNGLCSKVRQVSAAVFESFSVGGSCSVAPSTDIPCGENSATAVSHYALPVIAARGFQAARACGDAFHPRGGGRRSDSGPCFVACVLIIIINDSYNALYSLSHCAVQTSQKPH